MGTLARRFSMASHNERQTMADGQECPSYGVSSTPRGSEPAICRSEFLHRLAIAGIGQAFQGFEIDVDTNRPH